MKKLSILTEAKQPKYVDIGDGYYVNKVGLDPNGNSSVWVSKGSGRAKKIQMGGTIPHKRDIMEDKLKFFQDKNDPDTKEAISKIKEYYKKYLLKEKKSARSYPSEQDANFLAELTNALNTVYTGGSSMGSRMIDEITKIRLSKWDEVFGDKSPWITVRSKRKGKLMDVKWDDAKAEKLGIGVFK